MSDMSENNDDTWVPAQPRDAITAVEQAAEAVRAANHASTRASDFDHGDLYRLMGELVQLTQRLPQLIKQTGRILRVLDDNGDIDTVDGNMPGALAVWDTAIDAASSHATQASQDLNRAFNEVSSVNASAAKLARSE